MSRVWFDAEAQVLAVEFFGTFAPGVLRLDDPGDGRLRLVPPAGKVPFAARWQDVRDGSGAGFATPAEAAAYLAAELAKGDHGEITDLLAAYILAKT